jgi:hypothetical protein
MILILNITIEKKREQQDANRKEKKKKRTFLSLSHPFVLHIAC